MRESIFFMASININGKKCTHHCSDKVEPVNEIDGNNIPPHRKTHGESLDAAVSNERAWRTSEILLLRPHPGMDCLAERRDGRGSLARPRTAGSKVLSGRQADLPGAIPGHGSDLTAASAGCSWCSGAVKLRPSGLAPPCPGWLPGRRRAAVAPARSAEKRLRRVDAGSAIAQGIGTDSRRHRRVFEAIASHHARRGDSRGHAGSAISTGSRCSGSRQGIVLQGSVHGFFRFDICEGVFLGTPQWRTHFHGAIFQVDDFFVSFHLFHQKGKRHIGLWVYSYSMDMARHIV